MPSLPRSTPQPYPAHRRPTRAPSRRDLERRAARPDATCSATCHVVCRGADRRPAASGGAVRPSAERCQPSEVGGGRSAMSRDGEPAVRRREIRHPASKWTRLTSLARRNCHTATAACASPAGSELLPTWLLGMEDR